MRDVKRCGVKEDIKNFGGDVGKGELLFTELRNTVKGRVLGVEEIAQASAMPT